MSYLPGKFVWFEHVSRDAKRALTKRAGELTAWLDGVRVSPRFPSPLSKLR